MLQQPAVTAAPHIPMTATCSELLQKATELHQQQKWVEAERCYRQVLQVSPNNADALHQLGALLVQHHGAKQYKDAVQLVRSAIQLAPSNARYRHSLGVVHEAAEQWVDAADAFQRAVEKLPNDVKARMHLARALKSAGQPARSVEVYKSVLQLQPNHQTAHYKLGSVLRHMGKLEAASQSYRRHLELDPHHVQAAFWLAALTQGSQAAACPPEIVSKLFDGYSDHFDDHLVNKLGYKTPAALMDCLLQYSQGLASSISAAANHQQQQQEPRWRHCVDLGCGTGLMGPLLRPYTQQLVGVDLSQGMVNKAQERACYDALAVDELVHFLQAAVEQQGPSVFDLLVAADVFVYIGDLQPVLQAAADAAVDRAVFAFSTELLKAEGGSEQTGPSSSTCSSSTCSEKTYVLQPTGRYAHSPSYLRLVARQSGWEVVMVKEAQIRQNAGQPIWGSLCLLQRVCNKQ